VASGFSRKATSGLQICSTAAAFRLKAEATRLKAEATRLGFRLLLFPLNARP